MATTNPTAYRLTIALIVFVLLTFILTITTYLFFKQRTDEQAKALAAKTEKETMSQTLAATKKDNEDLRALIGASEKSFADIESEFKSLFESDFSGFTGEQSYRSLVDWLRGEFKKKGELTKAAEDKSAEAAKKAEQAEASAKEAREKAETRVGEIRATQEKQDKAYQDDRDKIEKEKDSLLSDKQKAEQASKRLLALAESIKMLKDLLPSDSWQQFDGSQPEDQLDAVRRELVSVRKILKSHNEELSRFRASGDKDRIDGFDGYIAAVDGGDGSVTIWCPSTRGARPGMELRVFQPDEQQPRNQEDKATLVVTSIEGPSRLRAAIRDESPTEPIIPGDAVASHLWSPGRFEIVVVGLGGTDVEDRTRLTRLIEGAGGRIAAAVTPSTAFVFDTGLPPAEDDESEAARQVRTKRESAIRDARDYGVPVGNRDGLLDFLGLSRTGVMSSPSQAAGSAR
ncbi:MAG: hypothetical protein KJS77_05715 [Planctomycetes bacterium]|nr:hypothetical protein [Planctomycetota bacterium]